MNRFILIIIFIFIFLSSCTLFQKNKLPASYGGYIPLEGLAVDQTYDADSCRESFLTRFRPLLDAFPDISIRFAVASFDENGRIVFGRTNVTQKGENYRVILDYINSDTINVTMSIEAYDKYGSPLDLGDLAKNRREAYSYKVKSLSNNKGKIINKNAVTVHITVYVGIGMRLTADIKAIEGGVNLTDLKAIGLEAQAKKLTGTITVQSIGLTGKSIATSLPLPSVINKSTIDNVISAIEKNKNLIYQNGNISDITITPRVVGLYSKIRFDPNLINAISSELSRERLKWFRPCY